MIGYNVHANGIRQHLIHYAEEAPGKLPELLIVPGITSPAVTWGFIAERLSADFSVHVLDVRGRGLSEDGPLDYSLDAMADDVIGLVESGAFERPIVLGHSMGARTAIRALRKAPGIFSSALLVDPPVSGPGRREYPSAWDWYENSILLAKGGCSAADMKEFCPTWTDEQLALRAEWLHTCQLDAIDTAYKGFHTDDIHVDLAHLKIPARLIVAGGGPVITQSDVEEIQGLAPHIEVDVVEGAGHMIPWDDLEGFLEAVRKPFAE